MAEGVIKLEPLIWTVSLSLPESAGGLPGCTNWYDRFLLLWNVGKWASRFRATWLFSRVYHTLFVRAQSGTTNFEL